eukprot:CAMPEP_0195581816 /NCGR_PEP_ID=MMETSP0814-20130614/21044_1 /TAXON_ID=97485 /ORGANISM="Prymnesium parvum, Strain Texoma1" /LENGTH=30 /DNA_ID= /DNA_START= /DNA_END= /DNA_ORIENTATION=
MSRRVMPPPSTHRRQPEAARPHVPRESRRA